MNIRIPIEISIHEAISIMLLLMIFICIQKIIIMRGIQIAIHELNRNLHLMILCLSSHFIVNHKFDNARLMLFVTASRAEQSLRIM